jgi:hypothetical protein
MRMLDPTTLKRSHGVRLSMGRAREWNGITVQVVELQCDPGRAWHDLSSPHASVKVVLEQVGGRVEVRRRINQPYDDRLAKLARLLAQECDMPDEMSSLYGDSLTMAIAIDLLRLEPSCSHQAVSSRLAPWQLRRATEYMTAHLSANVRRGHLARVAGLSQPYLGRAFKASTGISPHRWLRSLRWVR